MDLYVGTSGYSYKEWKGTFYPKDLPIQQMLRFYGERFRTVEINNTFYRMPSASVLEGWADVVPADFKFVLKAPKLITHLKQLKNADESASHFLEVDYEAMVEDAAGQTRRILDFLGLPWDEACLRFHETQRPVRTASVNQVRQPIYSTSVGRWRKHAAQLQPLLEALGVPTVPPP